MQMIEKKALKKELITFIDSHSDINPKLAELKCKLIDDNNCTGKNRSSPGEANLNSINSTSETAFQRAIYNDSPTTFKLKNGNTRKIEWLDLELPVVLNKSSRRICLDLIGLVDNTPTICELKYFKNSAGDHPVYAIFEVLVYYYFVLCNYKKLDDEKIHHTNLKKFVWKSVINTPTPIFLVAANDSYWDYWLHKRRGHSKISKQLRLALDFADKLRLDIHILKAPNEDFEKQKNNSTDNEHYSPKILNSGSWETVHIP